MPNPERLPKMPDPFAPGMLDGPPAEEKITLSERIGIAVVIIFFGSIGLLVLSGVWWGIAWLWGNLPT
jgi:hypothetical protein